MKRKNVNIGISIVIIYFLCFAGGLGKCANAMEVKIEPSTLLLGTFYRGADIKISGTVPIGSDVVVRFIGNKKDLHLKKKGKVLGLLWMNLDTFTFKGVPNVCLIYSSKKLVSDDKQCNVESDAWKLSLLALESHISIEPEPEDRTFLVEELVKMKKLEGLYVEQEHAVGITERGEGAEKFEAHVKVPSSLTPGKYMVEVYALQDGKIIDSKITPINAKLVGLPAFLYNLAFQHALLYGLLATIVAILGGLLMGVIFGAGKGAH
ncbi:MAG TPA: hypothetical protein ENG51_18495 [Deltaproteobacteria bacterium]|nr:hypothetical protein [Deltaproteobacteria bacterium]